MTLVPPVRVVSIVVAQYSGQLVATLAGLTTLANISAQAVPLPPVHSTIAHAVSVLSLAKPAASVSTDAALAVCFAPEEDCVAFAVRAIDYAER